METRKITDLPEYSSDISGTEVVEIVSGNTNYQCEVGRITGISSFSPLTGANIDFSQNSNFTRNLTSNLQISVSNAKPGQVRVINTTQTGAFNLLLPTSHLKMGGWDTVTPTSNNVVCYTILFDGSRYLWNRAAYE